MRQLCLPDDACRYQQTLMTRLRIHEIRSLVAACDMFTF